MTKVNNIELRRAHSGRQYLIFYDESEDAFILGDDGYYPVKIPTDIVESLELVDIVHTMKELEYFLENTGAQSKVPNHNDDINSDQYPTTVYKIEIRRAKSGKQYLVLCTNDGYAIVDDTGYLEKLSTDIAESLTLVESLHTTLFYDREF